MLWILLYTGILAGAFAAWVIWSNHTFEETFYTLYSVKIETPVRMVLLTDLHQKSFGKDNETLIARIARLEPDLILVSGDVVNKDKPDLDYAVGLCEKLTEIAPVYYGLGNHENEVIYGADLNKDYLEAAADQLGDHPEDLTPLIRNGELLDRLEAAGVCVVQNQSVMAEIKDNQIEIGGISTNISSFWPYSGQFVYRFAKEDTQPFKVLISHRPEPVAQYIMGYPIDLVVSGHNHGGIVRIPGKGGLFSVDQGFFPEYDAGLREQEGMTMVIGRGLGGHGVIPRVFNRPELVIIDIH